MSSATTRADAIRLEIDELLAKIDAAESASVVTELGKELDSKIEQLAEAEAEEAG